MLRRVPFEVYAVQGERLQRIERLAAGVRDSLDQVPPGSGAIRIPDDSFWLPGLHNGRISTRLFVAGFVRDSRLALGTEIVDERSAAFLNPIFSRWNRSISTAKSAISIKNGRLHDAEAVHGVDFEHGAYDEQVISGFYPWEGKFRWMGARGELRLTLATGVLNLGLTFPRNLLMALDPTWGDATLSVRLVDELEGTSGEPQTVRLSEDGLHNYILNVESFAARYGGGRPVRVVLECPRTWRPIDVVPGASDARDLCLQVIGASF